MPSCLSTLQTLALELKKLYFALSDKKKDLLKAMTWPSRTTNLFPDCFEKLQVYLEHTQAAAASRSKSLKAGLDYNRSYQVRVSALARVGTVLGCSTDPSLHYFLVPVAVVNRNCSGKRQGCLSMKVI